MPSHQYEMKTQSKLDSIWFELMNLQHPMFAWTPEMCSTYRIVCSNKCKRYLHSAYPNTKVFVIEIAIYYSHFYSFFNAEQYNSEFSK